MKKLLTPTLALILAGGLAAGIALSRPASQAAEPIPTTRLGPSSLNQRFVMTCHILIVYHPIG